MPIAPLRPSKSYQQSDARETRAESVTEPTFDYEAPVPLFDGPYWISSFPYPSRAFDISRDGQRLLVIKQGAATGVTGEEPEIHVVLNWFEELTRLVPTN